MLNPQNISIGSNTYVNGGFLIAGANSRIRIGQDCLISYNVHCRTDSHNFRSKDQLIRSQGHSEADISIGNDVWVGFGAQIMSGISVGDGAVVAAGAVVTKDVEPYSIVAGVPAAVISRRE